MRILRRSLLLACVAVASAVLAGPAFGARLVLPFTVDTPHFVVHYQSDLGPGTVDSAITQTTAGDIAALAGGAHNSDVVHDGFPAPLNDGDGKTDIYVLKLAGALGATIPDTPAALTSSSYIELDGATPELAFTEHTIAHEFFHTIQVTTWLPPAASDYWLLEGSAE